MGVHGRQIHHIKSIKGQCVTYRSFQNTEIDEILIPQW